MEGTLILVAVIALLSGPIAFVLALLAWGRLRAIERELRALRSPSQTPPAGDEAGSAVAARARAGSAEAGRAEAGRAEAGPAEPWSPTPSEGAPTPSRSPRRRDLESRIGGEWLTWIGVFAIFFGTAFFLAVSLGDHPLAGLGQVLIGIGVAAGFLIVGVWVSGRTSWFLAEGLLGGGTALVFLSIFAASAFHRLITATPSYGLLAAAAVLGAWLALGRGSRTVAGLTLAGALITPIILEPQSAHPLFFPYLIFVNLGAILVRIRKSWPGLVLAAFLGTVLHVVFWWDRFFEFETRTEALFGVLVLWLLYAGLPLVVRPASLGWRLAGTALVFGNAGASAWFLSAWLGRWDVIQGPLTALVGLVYVAVAHSPAGRRRPEVGTSFELAGFFLGSLAIPIHFDLGTVTLGWAFLALVLLHLGIERRSPGHRYSAYALLALSAGHHILFHLPGVVEPDRNAANWIPGLLVALVILAAAGLLLRRRRRDAAAGAAPVLSSWESAAPTPFLLLAAAFLLYVVSTEVWSALEGQGDRRQQVGLSFSWALYGGLLIAIGFLTKLRSLRLSGVGLLLLLVSKVFLLDMSVLERGERIASFIGVGVLLLVVSILYQRRRT